MPTRVACTEGACVCAQMVRMDKRVGQLEEEEVHPRGSEQGGEGGNPRAAGMGLAMRSLVPVLGGTWGEGSCMQARHG